MVPVSWLTARSTDNPPNPIAATAQSMPSDRSGAPSGEYERLQHWLQLTTLALSLVASLCVAVVYSPPVAANYALGAIGGIIYLRLLGRGVADLGKGRKQLGLSRLAVFIGLIIVASRMDSLQILPIFFGFISYKFTLLLHLLQILFRPTRTRSH